jgi:hypothetical protein
MFEKEEARRFSTRKKLPFFRISGNDEQVGLESSAWEIGTRRKVRKSETERSLITKWPDFTP